MQTMDPNNKETEYPVINNMSSIPPLMNDSSDHEDDSGLPNEPPGAPALPVDENGNVVYKYRDFSHVDENDDDVDGEVPAPTQTNQRSTESSIRVQKFPVKLYAILAQKEFHDIICWMPHGRAWKVLKPNMFESLVMPLFFEYSNYHSFNRLVNAWSFRRISSGPDRGAYYHELFLRGKPHLQNYMRRLPKTHKKLPMKKKDEPNFYKLDQTHPLPAIHEAPIPGQAAVQVMRSRFPQQTGASSSTLDIASSLSPISQQQQQMIVTPNISPNHGGQGIMGSPGGFMSNSSVGNGQYLGSNMNGMGSMGSGGMGMSGMGGMNSMSQGSLGMGGRSGMGMGLGGMGAGAGSGAQSRFGGFNDIDDYDIIPMHSYGGRGLGNNLMEQQGNFINPMMGNAGGYGGMGGNYGSSNGRSMKNSSSMMQGASLDMNSQWQTDYFQGFSQSSMMPNMQQQNDMYGRGLAAGLADDFSTASSGAGPMGQIHGVKL